MHEKSVRIPAINCGHCVATIKRELDEIDGIEHVEADLNRKEAIIRWRAPLTWELIREKLEEIGYPPEE